MLLDDILTYDLYLHPVSKFTIKHLYCHGPATVKRSHQFGVRLSLSSAELLAAGAAARHWTSGVVFVVARGN